MKVMNGAHHNCNPVTLCKLFARGYNWVPGRASPSENSSMHTLVNGNRKTKQTSKTATLPFWNILTHDISRPFRAGKWLSYVEMTITTQGILGATDHTLHVLRVAACLAILQNTNTQVSNKFCWPSDMYCSVLSSCRDYILYISLYIALPFRFTCLLIFCLLVGAIKLSNCPNRPEAFVHQEDHERYGLRFTLTSRPFLQLCVHDPNTGANSILWLCCVSFVTIGWIAVDFNLFAEWPHIVSWNWGYQPFSAKTSVNPKKNNSPSETGPIVCPSMTSRSTPRE